MEESLNARVPSSSIIRVYFKINVLYIRYISGPRPTVPRYSFLIDPWVRYSVSYLQRRPFCPEFDSPVSILPLKKLPSLLATHPRFLRSVSLVVCVWASSVWWEGPHVCRSTSHSTLSRPLVPDAILARYTVRTLECTLFTSWTTENSCPHPHQIKRKTFTDGTDVTVLPAPFSDVVSKVRSSVPESLIAPPPCPSPFTYSNPTQDLRHGTADVWYPDIIPLFFPLSP